MKQLWIFFIMISSIFSAQQYSIFYKESRLSKIERFESFNLVSLQDHKDYEQIKQTLPDQNKLQKYRFRSVVRVDNEKSLYYPLDTLGNDSYDNNHFVLRDSLQLRSRIITNRNFSIIYLNLLNRQKISTEIIRGKRFLIQEYLSEHQWIPDDSTRVINNYKCKVALLDPINCECSSPGHRHYKEVWYTEEMPANVGPMGLWGLPGLVIEVLTNEYRIYFDKIIYSLQNEQVNPPTKGEKIDRHMIDSFLFSEIDDH